MGLFDGTVWLARREKRANDLGLEETFGLPREETFADRHPVLARVGRVAATGLGGALGHAAGNYGVMSTQLGSAMPYAMPALGAAAGAGLGNYLAGGDAGTAALAGLGAGAGSYATSRWHHRESPREPAPVMDKGLAERIQGVKNWKAPPPPTDMERAQQFFDNKPIPSQTAPVLSPADQAAVKAHNDAYNQWVANRVIPTHNILGSGAAAGGILADTALQAYDSAAH